MLRLGPPNVKKLAAKHDLNGLVNALGYQKDPQVGDDAAKALEAIGTAAVEPLIGVLHHKDPSFRLRAIGVLGELGDARAVEPLTSGLHDTNGRVRFEAARALALLGDARAVEPLLVAVHAGDQDLFESAVEALVELGGARAVEPMIGALQDKNKDVRLQAVRDLKLFGDLPVARPSTAKYRVERDQETLVAAMKTLVQAGGALAVGPLIDALKDEDKHVRDDAIEVLGVFGDARAVEPLIDVLHDEDKYVRGYASRALGVFGDPRAVEPLIGALHDQNASVRVAAAEALGQIDDARAVKALREVESRGRKDTKGRRFDMLLPIASAVKSWYHESAAMQTGNGICDDCSSRLVAGKTYLRPGGYLCCERCTDNLLSTINWHEAVKNIDSYVGPGVPQDIKMLASRWH